MKKLTFFLVLLFSLALSKAQQTKLTSVYARVEFSDPDYSEMDVVPGPGGYSTGWQYATAELKFYADAACTSPTTLPVNTYLTIVEYYVVHDIYHNFDFDQYIGHYTNQLFPAGTSSVLLSDHQEFYYENIQYDVTPPYDPVYAGAASTTYLVTENSPGALVILPPHFNFSVSPYYYF